MGRGHSAVGSEGRAGPLARRPGRAGHPGAMGAWAAQAGAELGRRPGASSAGSHCLGGIHPSIHPPTRMSLHPRIYPSMNSSTRVSMHPFVHRFIHTSILCPCILPSMHSSTSVPMHLCIHRSIYPSIHPSLPPSLPPHVSMHPSTHSFSQSATPRRTRLGPPVQAVPWSRGRTPATPAMQPLSLCHLHR